MKKLVICCIMMIFAGSAFAENAYQDKVKFGVRYDDSSDSIKDQVNVRFDLDREWNNGFKLGYGSRTNHRFEGNKNNQRHMIRLGQEFGNFQLNGHVGIKLPHGKDHSYFWTVQPGYKFKLSDSWQARVSYDYREGFKGKDDDYRYGPRLRLKKKFAKGSVIDAVEFHFDHLTFKDQETRNRIGIAIEKKI